MTTRTNHGANISLERIDAPPFQLPPHPPGHPWHREDGWTAEDLPPGTRPLCFDEPNDCKTDEYTFGKGDGWDAQVCRQPKPQQSRGYWRTTRPLVFTHNDKQWTYHRSGDPMPCDGERRVKILRRDTLSPEAKTAKNWNWKLAGVDTEIIGWRYAEPATKEVELGPQDVPPGSVFRGKAWQGGWLKCWISCLETGMQGVHFNRSSDLTTYKSLRNDWLINRPRHRDADGNPTLWEKCSKEVPA